MTDLEIEAAIARAAEEPEGVTILSVVYRPETGLDLSLFTLSDCLIFRSKSTWPDAWWTALDVGVPLDGLLEGQLGDENWMRSLRQTEPSAA